MIKTKNKNLNHDSRVIKNEKLRKDTNIKKHRII